MIDLIKKFLERAKFLITFEFLWRLQNADHKKDVSRQNLELIELASFANDFFGGLARILPTSRKGQMQLVANIEESIEAERRKFKLSKEFVRDQIGVTDSTFVNAWRGSARDLSWLLVHEQLSDYFASATVSSLGAKPYFVHHVPKSGGTTVLSALANSTDLLVFDSGNFEHMCRLYGMLGFGQQLTAYRRQQTHTTDLHICGHFNLPTKIDSLSAGNGARGITLCRAPMTTILSAVRYIWTNVSEQDDQFSGYASLADRQTMVNARRKIMTGDTVSAELFERIFCCIVDSPLFREHFDNVISRHYLNSDINDAVSLLKFLRDMPGLAPVLDLRSQMNFVEMALGVRIGRSENISFISEQEFLNFLPLSPVNYLADRMPLDLEVYDVLKTRLAEYPF